MTEEEKRAKEEKAAKLIARLEGFFEKDGGYSKMSDKLKAVETIVEEFKGLELKGVSEQLELLKAGQEKLTGQIRNSTKGLYVSGIEDENFSMLGAMIGVNTNVWKGFEKEKEILDQVREKQGQIAGEDVAGRYFIPDQVIADIIGPIYTRSAFVNLGSQPGQTNVSVLDGLMGGNVKVPKFNGGLVAYWIGEEEEYIESMTGVGDMSMTPHKLGVLIRITDTMRRFGGYGYENLLRSDMIEAVAKKIDWTMAYGSGSANSPLGLANNPKLKVFLAQGDNGSPTAKNVMYQNLQAILDAGVTATGAPIDFDMLSTMQLTMEEDDIYLDENTPMISAPRTFHKLRTAKIANYPGQTTEQPYMLGAPMLTEKMLKEVIGPYGKTNQISSTQNPGAGIVTKTNNTLDGKCSTIFGGNLREVIFGRWAGIEISNDGGMGKGFTNDHIYTKLRLYADIGVREERAVFVAPDIQVRD